MKCQVCNKPYKGRKNSKFCSIKCSSDGREKHSSVGSLNPMYGKHHTEESNRKNSESKKKNPTRYWLGKKRPDVILRNKLKNPTKHGIDSNLWRGGKMEDYPIKLLIRKSFLYRQWNSDCMHRDDFICTDCQKKGGILNVHHIKEFHIILEEYNIKDVNGAENCAELWDLNNGVTLCKSCHIKRHKK